MARVGLLDVHRDERRFATTWPGRGLDEQSQLRGTSGRRGAHVARESTDCRRLGHCGRRRRPALVLTGARQLMASTPFRPFTSRYVVLPSENIDTDQIIPARYLTTTESTGLGPHAFHDWRYSKDGTPNPAFPLNAPS